MPYQNPLTTILANAVNLGRWQRRLLTLAMLVFGAGAVGQWTGTDQSGADRPEANAPAASHVASKQKAPSPSEPTFREQLSPWATRVGASFMGGFLLGFALRTFLRITATIIALGAALFMGISYFGGKNLDLTEYKTKYDSGIHWLEDQASRLKDSAESHLPHSGSGFLGAFTGFRRKRVTT